MSYAADNPNHPWVNADARASKRRASKPPRRASTFTLADQDLAGLHKIAETESERLGFKVTCSDAVRMLIADWQRRSRS